MKVTTENKTEHLESAPLPSRRLARLAFAAMLAIYFSSYFERTAVPGTIFNELQKEWNLSASAIVALGSVFLWVYGSMQLVVGITVDRFGGIRNLLVGGVILAVGATLFPFVRTPGLLYVSRAVTAVGDSFVFLSIVKEISLLFDRRRFTLLLSVLQGVGPLGGMAAMLPFERATHFFGWRTPLQVMGLFITTVVAANFLILPKLKHFVPHTRTLTLRPVLEILRKRCNWPMFVISLINFPIYFVLQVGVGKKFLQDFAGLSSQHAATFTLIMMTVSAVIVLSSSFLLDHCGGRRKPLLLVAVGLLLIAMIMLMGGTYWGAGPGVFLAAYIVLASSSLIGLVGMTMMKEMNDTRHIAQALAVINTLSYLGVAVLLMISGSLLDLFKGSAQPTASGMIYPARAYLAVFLVFTVMAIISTIAATFLPETHEIPASPSDLPEVAEVP